MVQLIILGGVFFMLGSLGNTIFLTKGILSIAKVVVSLVIIFFATVYFFIDPEIDNWLVNTSDSDQNFLFFLFPGTALGVGFILLFLQLHTVARLIIPAKCVENSKKLSRWLLPGAVSKEVRTKQAAAYKTNRMVENAMALHLNDELSAHKSLRSSGFMSGNSHAMTAFLEKRKPNYTPD